MAFVGGSALGRLSGPAFPSVRCERRFEADTAREAAPSVPRRAFLALVAALPAPALALSTEFEARLEEKLKGLRFDPSKVVRKESGLKYFDIDVGSGEAPAAGTRVSIQFLSRLQGFNGIKLDSTGDHAKDGVADPFTFTYGSGEVVPGLEEGLEGMKAGGVRRIVVPPALGYRSENDEPRPQDFAARQRLRSVLYTNRDATIVFDVELVRVR
eukprot:tig00000215_g18661.t1